MKCYSAFQAGAVTFIMPLVQVFANSLCGFVMKKVVSVYIRVAASLVMGTFLILFGYFVRGEIYLVCIFLVFYSLGYGFFFLSNNNFQMTVASQDVKSMLAGCMSAFNWTGTSFGVAILNLLDDVYLRRNWLNPTPVDLTCSSEEFLEFARVYYESYFMTSCCMAAFGLLSAGFVAFAGISEQESSLIGYKRKNQKKFVLMQ